MSFRDIYIILLFIVIILTYSCNNINENNSIKYTVTEQVHTFYYNWYASLEHDGKYHHWNHDILPHWSDTTWNNAGGFPGGNDIGANFYPSLACYSSNDPKIINEHFSLMQQAGIGVCVITWWGKDSFEDQAISTYLEIAEKYDIKIAFHIEPFYKSIKEFKEQLEYLNTHYNHHQSIYKLNGKPFYYIYDSYKIDSKEWAKLFNKENYQSIRNTNLDGTFIGLFVQETDTQLMIDSYFDGFYTYFASDGFVYGSTSSNWKFLSDFANSNHLIFIPCVGPGYDDTRIRPWNAQNKKDRANGLYYEKMFNSAAELNPDYIGITSFNEWHEGTQIEPAISKKTSTFTYEDYGNDISPHFYIQKTRELVDAYKK